MDKEKNEEIEKYKLILEHCMIDLKSQDERKVNVDTKTSYILVILVFLLGVILQSDVGKTIIGEEFCKKEIFQIVIRICVLLSYFADIILGLISMFFLVNVLINKKYKKINTQLWDINNLDDVKEIDVIKGLIDNYTKVIKNNSEINDKVMKMYKKGIIFLIISIFFTITIFLINIFL